MLDVYLRQELLDIYKNPYFKGALLTPTVSSVEKNPMCGDIVSVELEIEGDIIKDYRYNGEACAVATISANLLGDEIIGKSLDFARKLTKNDLLSLFGVTLTTSRVKCAELPLLALLQAIKNYEHY